jgi:hypothetical protein
MRFSRLSGGSGTCVIFEPVGSSALLTFDPLNRRGRKMDAIRRAKIKLLIPILKAVEEAVGDLASEEEDAVHGTHGNLRGTAQAQSSNDAFDALDQAWDHVEQAIEKLNDAVDDEPELPAAPVTINRRGL